MSQIEDRIDRLGKLQEALTMSASSAQSAGRVDLDDVTLERIRAGLRRIERGGR